MRKTFLKVSILGMLTVGMAAGFTSCKDYDNDIDNLQKEIDAVKNDLKAIQDLVKSGVVITNVAQNADGVTITMSNNQTYTIKNGTNGAPGKDADVWTIVKNDKGEYMWAKNNVITEFPAQGPAGTAVAGSYYVPNAETGVFDEYKDGKLVGPTTIPCFAKGSKITAVDDGMNVTISGLVDADGKELAPVTLSKTGALSSLEFIPDLYVNGIESMRANYVDMYISTSSKYNDNASDATQTTPATYVIKKGEFEAFAPAAQNNNNHVVYRATETAQYFLNPTNANLSKVQWSFFTNDATIASRGSKAVATVVGTPTAKDGVLTVNYTLGNINNVLTNGVATGTSTNPNAGANPDGSKQTIMALQATLEDNSVVYSNFVALKKQLVKFAGIQYATSPVSNDTPATLPVFETSVKAATAKISDKKEIPVAWDATTDLTKYIRIAYTVTNNEKPAASEPGTQYYTIQEMKEKFGMTMSYAILKYDKLQKGISTAQNNYGLVDANGKLIYGGFITLIIENLGTQSAPIVLNRKASMYLSCTKPSTYATTGAEFNQEVLVPLNISATNFNLDYDFVPNVLGVMGADGKVSQLPASNSNNGMSYDYGSFSYVALGSGAEQTQGLKFQATIDQWSHWYPYDYDGNGKYEADNYTFTNEPLNKTLFAQFKNKKSGNILWVGVDITFTGVPTITKVEGYLDARWIKGNTVAPVNPADPAVAGTKANTIKVGPTDLWANGQPVFTANAPYIFNGDYKNVASKPSFEFAFKQEFTLAGKSLDGKKDVTIYTQGQGTQLVACLEFKSNGWAKDPKLVATIGTDGVITFTYDETNPYAFVNQIIRSEAYSKTDPKILFDVELYADYVGTCAAPYADFSWSAYATTYKIGVGRPIDAYNANPIASVIDHATAQTELTMPIGNIFSVKDWAGNAFAINGKKTITGADGKQVTVTDPNYWIANEIKSGVWAYGFWMKKENGTVGTIQIGSTATIKGSTTDNYADAKDYSEIKISFASVTLNADGTVKSYGTWSAAPYNIQKGEDFNTYIKIENEGTQITQDLTIFIPVTINSVWGPISKNVPVLIKVNNNKG